MKYLAFAIFLAGVAHAQAGGINFGEVQTRFETQNKLAASPRLHSRDVDWNVDWDVDWHVDRNVDWNVNWAADWRHTHAWQHGNSRRTEFAPRGCTIRRFVTTPSGRRLQELFIC
jgi:hypothetical protein